MNKNLKYAISFEKAVELGYTPKPEDLLAIPLTYGEILEGITNSAVDHKVDSEAFKELIQTEKYTNAFNDVVHGKTFSRLYDIIEDTAVDLYNKIYVEKQEDLVLVKKNAFIPFSHYPVLGHKLNEMGITPDELGIHSHTEQIAVWWDLETILGNIDGDYEGYPKMTEDDRIRTEQDVFDEVKYNGTFDDMSEAFENEISEACKRVFAERMETSGGDE
ncbi:MAG: hypothetical protein ACRCX2_38990 [Paraclostridium sp.]